MTKPSLGVRAVRLLRWLLGIAATLLIVFNVLRILIELDVTISYFQLIIALLLIAILRTIRRE